MWFKIAFYPMEPISVAIAEDLTLYFKASDVGRFLGYTNPYGFAKRHARRDFNEMLPARLRSKQQMVFTFDEMIQAIHFFKEKHEKSRSLDTEHLKTLWLTGRTDIPIPNYPIMTLKYAPLMHVQQEAGMNIQHWIQAYAEIVVKLYAFVRQKESADNFQNPQSVESNYYYDPSADKREEAIDVLTPPPSVEQQMLKTMHINFEGFNSVPDRILINVLGFNHEYPKKSF